MEEIFEIEAANEEFVDNYLDEYNTMLKCHDETVRDIICSPDGREQKEGSPYKPTKLSTAPFDPDVALLMFIREKVEKSEKAKAKMAEKVKETEAEDPELAKIRQQKMQKMMKGK